MTKPRLIFYGWFIVATGVILYAVGYGARYSFSVIFPSLFHDFHWPRDITAIMLSVHMLVYGLVSPLAGKLTERMGPRKTMASGTILLSLGLALSSIGNEPWHFYLTFGVLSGAGLCFIGAVPLTTVLRNWFEKKRALAFSLLFFGAGASFAWYPAVAFLIQKEGWRYTFVVEAVITAGIILPLIFLVVQYHPRQKGLLCDGELEDEIHSQDKVRAEQIIDRAWTAIDWTLPRAVRTGRFWLLCISTFSIWGIMQHIMVAHHVAFAIDVGYSEIYASSVFSLFGIMFAFGSLAAFFSDRIGRELAMTISASIGISGIFVLMLVNSTAHPWMLYYYAIALGFGLGMSAPLIAVTTTDIFQGPNLGATIGSVWFSFAIGGSIGPWLGGWIFELTQGYKIAFIVAMACYSVACIAIWVAAPRQVRRVPGKAKAFI